MFVSCVRACVRAKLCGRVREVLPNAGGLDGNKPDSGPRWSAASVVDPSAGFKVFVSILVTLPWVLTFLFQFW